MKNGILAALFCTGLYTASSWAVMPLSEKQLKTVCMAFAENKRALEGQMCGHYVLGLLDGDISGGNPRRICVPESVKLANVMTLIVENTADIKVSETRPARDQVVPMLAAKWPCAAAKGAAPTPAQPKDAVQAADPANGGDD
jgi:hypothetical protein